MICIKLQVVSPEIIYQARLPQEDPDELLNYYWDYYVWLPVG